MEVEVKLEQGRQEPKVVILAGEDSPELRHLADSLSKLALSMLSVCGCMSWKRSWIPPGLSVSPTVRLSI